MKNFNAYISLPVESNNNILVGRKTQNKLPPINCRYNFTAIEYASETFRSLASSHPELNHNFALSSAKKNLYYSEILVVKRNQMVVCILKIGNGFLFIHKKINDEDYIII